MSDAPDEDLTTLELHELLERSAQARARARKILRRLHPVANSASEHDLSAQLALARLDLRTLDRGLQHAWTLDLGYGPSSPGFGARVSVSREGSPVLSHGERTNLDAGYHDALDQVALAHHHYGDMPDGQTIWPATPLHGRDADGNAHHRIVPIDEARDGVAMLDLVLAELQRCRHDLGAQEISVALDVASAARQALLILPAELWETVTDDRRPCVGTPDRTCGRRVQDESKRCWACRQRLSRMQRSQAS